MHNLSFSRWPSSCVAAYMSSMDVHAGIFSAVLIAFTFGFMPVISGLLHGCSWTASLQCTIKVQCTKQVSREARETIHIRRTNPALNCNIGKMYIPSIFNQILGTFNKPSTDISTNSNIQNPCIIPQHLVY